MLRLSEQVPTARRRSRASLVSGAATLLLVATAATLSADDLGSETTWGEVVSRRQGIVFGRIDGRFDGAEYRRRRVRVREIERGEEHVIDIDRGLGDFAAVLPVGSYELVSIEAVYLPRIRPLDLERFPPVQQRYDVQPIPDSGLPTFPVVADQPLYLGSIRSGLGGEGLVYDGHSLEIVDDFTDAVERLSVRHPALFASMEQEGVAPARFFFLRPQARQDPLALADVPDPLAQARDYMEDGKFRQAMSWLQTFMPTTDAERTDMRVLVGEIYLADKRYADAIDALGDVLLEDPENSRALRLLARAHAFEGHRDDSLDLYRALMDSLPKDAEATLHLGYDFALSSDKEEARAAFEAAFESNFDYLLHDLSPYALALKADGAEYDPPEVLDGVGRVPSTMRSRRSAQGAFALLLDHQGTVVAAHLSPNASEWAPAMMMSMIRARFKPARLNGVPIPCLIIIGSDNLIDRAN